MIRKILIIDDEPKACSNLEKKILELEPEWSVQWEINPLLALEKIRRHCPDIIFLDVQMPLLDGFSFLDQIPKDERKFCLVFCTAYSEYAVKAFEEHALDYLLKPVEPLRLQQTIQRIKSQKEKLVPVVPAEILKNNYLDRILLRKMEKVKLVETEDVALFFSDAHETIADLDDGEYFCELPLSQLEERLNPEMFFRCHRNTIVNLNRVLQFEKTSNEIQLKGSKRTITVSKRSRTEFIKRLKLKSR